MTAKDVLRCIRRRAKTRGLTVQLTEGRGSHKKVTVGGCVTTIPFHVGEGIGRGLRRAIERDLEPCLGEKWLR